MLWFRLLDKTFQYSKSIRGSSCKNVDKISKLHRNKRKKVQLHKGFKMTLELQVTVAALYLLSPSGRVPPTWGAYWNRHHFLIAFSTYLRAPSTQVPSSLILVQASHWPPGGVTSRSPLQCEWIKRLCDTQRKNSRSRTHARAPDNFMRITTGARTLKGHYPRRKRLRKSYRFMQVGDFYTSVFLACACARLIGLDENDAKRGGVAQRERGEGSAGHSRSATAT